MKPEDILDNWITLNAYLLDLEEKDVEQLLVAEKAGENRPTFAKRIHARLCVLRTRRERKELTE